MIINNTCPPVRSGLSGYVDRFIGPGATRAEILLQVIVSILAAVMALWNANYIEQLHWSVVQQVICALLAVDIVDGVTSRAKRWYHRPGQSLKAHMIFILLHFIQLFLVCWLFLSSGWGWIGLAGGDLVIAALIFLNTTLYLQRSLAMIMYVVALILSRYVLSSPPGMGGFCRYFIASY